MQIYSSSYCSSRDLGPTRQGASTQNEPEQAAVSCATGSRGSGGVRPPLPPPAVAQLGTQALERSVERMEGQETHLRNLFVAHEGIEDVHLLVERLRGLAHVGEDAADGTDQVRIQAGPDDGSKQSKRSLQCRDWDDVSVPARQQRQAAAGMRLEFAAGWAPPGLSVPCLHGFVPVRQYVSVCASD